MITRTKSEISPMVKVLKSNSKRHKVKDNYKRRIKIFEKGVSTIEFESGQTWIAMLWLVCGWMVENYEKQFLKIVTKYKNRIFKRRELLNTCLIDFVLRDGAFMNTKFWIGKCQLIWSWPSWLVFFFSWVLSGKVVSTLIP